MDERLIRRLLDNDKRQQRTSIARSIGTVTDDSPLTVEIGGVERTDLLFVESYTPRIGDRVWVARAGGEPPVILGAITDTSFSGGTWHSVPHFGNSTNAAMTADTLYYGQIVVPVDCTLTGIHCLCITTSSGSAKGMLFNASGTLLKSGTGTTLVTASPMKLPFSSGAYSAKAGVYFAAVIFSAGSTIGNTLKQAPAGSNASGSYASPPSSISVPTAVTSGPTIGTY